LGFYKTRRILLSHSANCTMLRAVVLTQYRRVTEGQTDGQTDEIAVASTALAKRRAVKTARFMRKNSVLATAKLVRPTCKCSLVCLIVSMNMKANVFQCSGLRLPLGWPQFINMYLFQSVPPQVSRWCIWIQAMFLCSFMQLFCRHISILSYLLTY